MSKLLEYNCVASDPTKAENFYRANHACTKADWESRENRELCDSFTSVAGGGSERYKLAQQGLWKYLPVQDEVPWYAWSGQDLLHDPVDGLNVNEAWFLDEILWMCDGTATQQQIGKLGLSGVKKYAILSEIRQICPDDLIVLSFLCSTSLGKFDIVGCNPQNLQQSGAYYAYKPNITTSVKGQQTSINGQAQINPQVLNSEEDRIQKLNCRDSDISAYYQPEDVKFTTIERGMFVFEQYESSRGFFIQLCLQPGNTQEFDITLTLNPIRGSGYDTIVKRFVRNSQFDDFFGTDCHIELYRGFEQVVISIGQLNSELQSDIDLKIDDVVTLNLQIALEPLYVPAEIREITTNFLMLALLIPGPFAILIGVIYHKCHCCKKKKKTRKKTGELFKMFLHKKIEEQRQKIASDFELKADLNFEVDQSNATQNVIEVEQGFENDFSFDELDVTPESLKREKSKVLGKEINYKHSLTQTKDSELFQNRLQSFAFVQKEQSEDEIEIGIISERMKKEQISKSSQIELKPVSGFKTSEIQSKNATDQKIVPQKSISKSSKDQIPFSELELQLYMPCFMENDHIRCCKCLDFKRQKLGAKYQDNVKRFFGNVLNYYTTSNWKLVVPSTFTFCLALFDQYSDINYVVRTQWNQQWMYYSSLFIVVFPFGVYVVISLRKYKCPSLCIATFLANFLHHEHALGKEEELEDKLLINTLIFALIEDIPQIGLQTVNNLWIGRSLKYMELITPFIGLLSAGFAVNKYFYISMQQTYLENSNNKVKVKNANIICQTLLFFGIFEALLLSIVYYIREITDNDELHQALPDWAQEFDFFFYSPEPKAPLEKVQGITCLLEYYQFEQSDDLWTTFNTVNAITKKIDQIQDWCLRDQIDLSAINGLECLLEEQNKLILLQESKQCNSIDFVLGSTVDVESCNLLCANYKDCQYFTYNKFNRECKMVKTNSPLCPEGFTQVLQQNFYTRFSGIQSRENLWNLYRSETEILLVIFALQSDCIEQNLDLTQISGITQLQEYYNLADLQSIWSMFPTARRMEIEINKLLQSISGIELLKDQLRQIQPESYSLNDLFTRYRTFEKIQQAADRLVDKIDGIQCLRERYQIPPQDKIWEYFPTVQDIYEFIDELPTDWCNRSAIDLSILPGIECITTQSLKNIEPYTLFSELLCQEKMTSLGEGYTEQQCFEECYENLLNCKFFWYSSRSSECALILNSEVCTLDEFTLLIFENEGIFEMNRLFTFETIWNYFDSIAEINQFILKVHNKECMRQNYDLSLLNGFTCLQQQETFFQEIFFSDECNQILESFDGDADDLPLNLTFLFSFYPVNTWQKCKSLCEEFTNNNCKGFGLDYFYCAAIHDEECKETYSPQRDLEIGFAWQIQQNLGQFWDDAQSLNDIAHYVEMVQDQTCMQNNFDLQVINGIDCLTKYHGLNDPYELWSIIPTVFDMKEQLKIIQRTDKVPYSQICDRQELPSYLSCLVEYDLHLVGENIMCMQQIGETLITIEPTPKDCKLVCQKKLDCSFFMLSNDECVQINTTLPFCAGQILFEDNYLYQDHFEERGFVQYFAVSPELNSLEDLWQLYFSLDKMNEAYDRIPQDWCNRRDIRLQDIEGIDCLLEIEEINDIQDLWYTYNSVQDIQDRIQKLPYGWCNRADIQLDEIVPGIDCLKKSEALILKKNVYCPAQNIGLGAHLSVQDCNTSCRETEGCQFFHSNPREFDSSISFGNQAEYCWHVPTALALCEEGFVEAYGLNFYMIYEGFEESSDLWEYFTSVEAIKEAASEASTEYCIKETFDLHTEITGIDCLVESLELSKVQEIWTVYSKLSQIQLAANNLCGSQKLIVDQCLMDYTQESTLLQIQQTDQNGEECILTQDELPYVDNLSDCESILRSYNMVPNFTFNHQEKICSIAFIWYCPSGFKSDNPVQFYQLIKPLKNGRDLLTQFPTQDSLDIALKSLQQQGFCDQPNSDF